MDKSDGWGIAAQGEQFVESGVRPSWKFFQSVLEPSKGIQVVQFGGSQQGLNDGGTNAGEFGTCVQPVFLADGDGANGVFHPVVVHGCQPAIQGGGNNAVFGAACIVHHATAAHVI